MGKHWTVKNRKPGSGRPANTADVLWSKVDKRGRNECWPWLGYRKEDGYGRTWIGDRGYYAHRVIFDLVNPGVISLSVPDYTASTGFVLHSCDNPICCNPKHLRLGSSLENTQDKIKRGRMPDYSGGKGPRCKLTMGQARNARTLKASGVSARELAKMFKISLASMKTLLRGDSYIDRR